MLLGIPCGDDLGAGIVPPVFAALEPGAANREVLQTSYLPL